MCVLSAVFLVVTFYFISLSSSCTNSNFLADNFVEVIKDYMPKVAMPSKPLPPVVADPPRPAAALPAPSKALAPPVAVLPKTVSMSVPPKKAQKKAKCLFDYVATQEDELSMKVNDIIIITKDETDGWCEGELNGNEFLKNLSRHAEIVI